MNENVLYATKKFEDAYTYLGKDLGADYKKGQTGFCVWAPMADRVEVALYQSGDVQKEEEPKIYPMQEKEQGVWRTAVTGDLDGVYYTYRVTREKATIETCDPYARAVGVNGQRAMVVDLKSTDPDGWEKDHNPQAGKRITDSVIYELHVRDLSIDKSSGIQQKGKFLGVIEKGTKTEKGIATGLDHIKDLGVTHIQFLPLYDYGSVDEADQSPQYNWGYDPVNYNVPEGSYASDPYDGKVRILEMKQMVQQLHKEGIGVIMDVVYNHVYDAGKFCMNQIVPGYFSRIDAKGVYSNGSGCGNDTASEHSMVRKYIVDSVVYWAKEYHIDGFRFDLVGLLDVETINEIVREVKKVRSDVLFYGEGWNLDTKKTKEVDLAVQYNSEKTPGFGYFNDTIRDCVKGSVFEATERGYVEGQQGQEWKITQCVSGIFEWCKDPKQNINYVSCHDNYTMMDKITLAAPEASRQEQIEMNRLAAAIYLLAQGVPLMQAGEEMLRSKKDKDNSFVENSYKSSDQVNAIRWDLLEQEEYQQTYAYYKGLIGFRKAYPQLRYTTREEIMQNVQALLGLEKNVTGLRIAEDILLIFNPNHMATKISLPKGKWQVQISKEKAGTECLKQAEEEIEVAPISAMALVREK